MIYSHWSQAPWDNKKWPNFGPWEFASPDNGQLYWWPEFFDKLQRARISVGKPFKINSAHRSYRYNLSVGGAIRSQHKTLAIDISLKGHNRLHVLAACKLVGFTGIGYYNTFLHVDLGRERFWYGAGAYSTWQSALKAA